MSMNKKRLQIKDEAISYLMKKDFKQQAHLYKIIALSKIDNGTSKEEIENYLKTHIELENYAICEGLKEAIDKKFL